MTETQVKMLRGVLDQLMTSYQISAEELSATHAYLFGERPISPMFKDKELFETLRYLRETIELHQLADVAALVAFYEDRKKEVDGFFDEALFDLDGQRSSPEPPAKVLHVQISDQTPITRTEWDTLASHITMEAGRLFENVYAKIIRFFESEPLPAGGASDLHGAVKRHVRELVTGSKLITLRWKLPSHTMLPDGIQDYVGQFASYKNKEEQVFVMQFARQHTHDMQTLIAKYQQLYQCSCKFTLWGQLHGHYKPDYSAIMEVIRREEPIADHYFKIQLTEWLVYSKLITSHELCEEEESQVVPDRLQQSFDHLFDCTSIRFYGGGDMHYWIQSLFESRLSTKKWSILKRPTGHFWLTSDNPGFMINIRELQGGFTHFLPRHSLLDIGPDSILYYPLSKDYCLKLEPKVALLKEEEEEEEENLSIGYAEPEAGELDFVNGVTVSTYKKVVITSEKYCNKYNFNTMAKNGKPGDGHRDGQVTKRSQTHNPKNDKWVKRNTDNGQFMDQKADDRPFKGVRKEK